MIRPTAVVTYPWKLKLGDWSWIGDHVTLYTLGEITIQENVVVSQNTYICSASHDYTLPGFDIYTKAVYIESEVWLASEVFVSPGVRIQHGTVVGARSLVLSDLPEMMFCAGHPARAIRSRIERSHRGGE